MMVNIFVHVPWFYSRNLFISALTFCYFNCLTSLSICCNNVFLNLTIRDSFLISGDIFSGMHTANMVPQPLGSLKSRISVGTVKYVFVFTIRFSFCIRIGELCRAKRVRLLLCGIFTFSCRTKSMEPCVKFFPHPCVFLCHPFLFSFVEQ